MPYQTAIQEFPRHRSLMCNDIDQRAADALITIACLVSPPKCGPAQCSRIRITGIKAINSSAISTLLRLL